MGMTADEMREQAKNSREYSDRLLAVRAEEATTKQSAGPDALPAIEPPPGGPDPQPAAKEGDDDVPF